jgi:hypothetical protein
MSAENTPVPTPATPAAAAVAAEVIAVRAPQTVTIPADQLQSFLSLQSRIVQLEQEKTQRETAATEERIRLMTEKGQAENAVKELRTQKDAELATEKTARVSLEDRAKRYALDGELSRVLASQPIVPGAADQLTKLWRGEFQVDHSGDSFTVRTPTFQTVPDFVTAQLARPEYSHFIRASNPGGGTAGGTAGTQLAAPTSPANPDALIVPKTFGEAIILQMQELRKGQPTDPRMNPAAAMGINSRSIPKQA